MHQVVIVIIRLVFWALSWLDFFSVTEACLEDPCVNGGTCVEEDGHTKCLCLPSYGGDFCQTGCSLCLTNILSLDSISLPRTLSLSLSLSYISVFLSPSVSLFHTFFFCLCLSLSFTLSPSLSLSLSLHLLQTWSNVMLAGRSSRASATNTSISD